MVRLPAPHAASSSPATSSSAVSSAGTSVGARIAIGSPSRFASCGGVYATAGGVRRGAGFRLGFAFGAVFGADFGAAARFVLVVDGRAATAAVPVAPDAATVTRTVGAGAGAGRRVGSVTPGGSGIGTAETVVDGDVAAGAVVVLPRVVGE